MLTWLSERREERRSNAAILTMIEGLLSVADDWTFASDQDGAFSKKQTFHSETLKVSLQWSRRDFLEEYNHAYRVILDGKVQFLPDPICKKVEKRINETRKRIEWIKAGESRINTETKLAQWIVDNHRALRRAELAY